LWACGCSEVAGALVAGPSQARSGAMDAGCSCEGRAWERVLQVRLCAGSPRRHKRGPSLLNKWAWLAQFAPMRNPLLLRPVLRPGHRGASGFRLPCALLNSTGRSARYRSPPRWRRSLGLNFLTAAKASVTDQREVQLAENVRNYGAVLVGDKECLSRSIKLS